ncbi:MAG: aminotransferase class V-fold PLP-dependent enzyme, partial [Jatrophihabitantaceae bacterium]
MAHLEGPLSAVQPESVVRAIIATLRSAPSQPGSRSARSQRAMRSVQQARQAVADLLGATPESVVLGASQADLTLRFAAVASLDWQLGDEIVLSRLDTDLQLRSWLSVARAKAVVVRWAEADLETGELPAWQYEQLIGRHTRIVTVPLGNPTTGTVPDVPTIAELAHDHGALIVVDAGSALTHLPISLEALGADLVTFTASTIGGPTTAAMAARPGLLLEITGGTNPPARERLEVGPLPVELLDGLTAAIDHLAGLGEPPEGPRRARILASVNAVREYTADLYARLDRGLRALPTVTVLGTSHE